MASLERVVRSLFDACDEGQKGILRSVQATMIGLAKKVRQPNRSHRQLAVPGMQGGEE
jgi:hypothetical protein